MNDFILGDLLRIPNTLNVVSVCWKLAEDDLQNEIKNYYPNSDEEFVTRLFLGRFAAKLRSASEQQFIEFAFLEDLKSSFPHLRGSYELCQIANGLVAHVTLHRRTAEKITGGDLGLMILRPQIANSGNAIKINDYRRGILCQVKLKDEKGKWGRFTPNQKKVLPERLGYLCILLYNYTDPERRHLDNFQWHICETETMTQLEEYLKRDTFPSLVDSGTIIQVVGHGIIGTDDSDTLDKIVSPARNPSLIITISWSGYPDGRYPESQVYVYSTSEERITTHVNQMVGY